MLANDIRADGETLENPPPSIVSVSSAANGTVEIVSQVDVVTLASATPSSGDKYTVTIISRDTWPDGIKVEYAAAGDEGDVLVVATKIAASINANSD